MAIYNLLLVQDELAANAEVREFLSRALPVYLGVPLAGFLIYMLLLHGNLVRATLKPFVGYVAGFTAAGVTVFIVLTRFEVPFGLLYVLMGGFGGRPFLALVFLLLSHVGAIVVGFLAALIAGRFEMLVAAISVWAGATLGYQAVICRGLYYEGLCLPFDPFGLIFDYIWSASYSLVALIGGTIAAQFAAR